MWHRKSVEKFLNDHEFNPHFIKEVQARITAVEDAEGLFSADKLDEVMGNPEIARAFEDAWETDEGLQAVAFGGRDRRPQAAREL